MHTAGSMAEMVGGRLIGAADRPVNGVAALGDAGADQISYINSKKYAGFLAESKAGTVIATPDTVGEATADRSWIVCDNAESAFNGLVMLFAKPAPAYEPGIHPSAVVDPSVKLGRNVHIGANAVIERDAEIGDDTVIGAGCYIGHEVKIGCRTLIYPNVTIMYRCLVGNAVILHPGVVIGADGFGFVPGPKGLEKVPQVGIVRIDNDVEVGANTTIDRARFDQTWIKSNVKIDDQVMVAHNVVVGESSILVAQVGIAGSARLGRGVVLGGKAGVNGHIQVGDGVQVAGTSNLVKSVPPKMTMIGTPAESQHDYMSRWTAPGRLERLAKKVAALEAELKALQEKKD